MEIFYKMADKDYTDSTVNLANALTINMMEYYYST